MNDDTVKLLRECEAGVKMGAGTLDNVMDGAKDERLKKILDESKEKHMELETETKKAA